MENIDKWLKSLRLHKYTPLFKSLTYEQMLNLQEKYLTDLNITKGARNKILISVQKLNKRQERLILIRDDLNQETTSIKEALTVLKEMLLTPIPPATESSYSSSASEASIESNSLIDLQQQQQEPRARNSSNPTDLTYLFVETFEQVAQRLIQSPGTEDSACHGIMAAIVDECSKHDSFTNEQKAKVASYKQHTIREQRAKMAGYKQHQPSFTKEHQLLSHQQRAKMASFKQQHQPNYHLLRQYPVQHQQQRVALGYNQKINYNSQSYQQQFDHTSYYHQNQKLHPFHTTSRPSLSSSISTIGSPSVSDEETGHQQTNYPEYSLLGPGMTFELPSLRERLLERGPRATGDGGNDGGNISVNNIRNGFSWANLVN